MKTLEGYLNEAFSEAFHSVRNNIGGPFGAVIVKNNTIIGKGGNRVIEQHDPTAHAEIVAIRNACKKIESFDLSGCILYATCEPCPMCLAAIYWANIDTVYYCSTRYDAQDIGFRDDYIYEELGKSPENRKLHFLQVDHHRSRELFEEWKKKQDKTPY